MKKITINYIECEEMTTGLSDDDGFFMVQVDGGPPQRFPADDTLEMNPRDNDKISFPNKDYPDAPQYFFKNTVYVSIWDHDGPFDILNEADMLGNVALTTDSQSGNYKVWGVNGAKYKISIDVQDVPDPVAMNGDDLPANLSAAASKAIKDWTSSSDGKKAMKETDPDKLKDLFSGALMSKAFKEVIDLALDFLPVKAVSLGVMGQVELFIGIEGTFGYAMDLKNFPHSSAVYCGVGSAQGPDAGIQGTLALGIWFESTQDIGGTYVGVEVDIDDIVGVTFAAYAGKSDHKRFVSSDGINLKFAKVIFLGIDIGFDDGVEAEETYFFAGHIEVENYPSLQDGTYKNMAMLTELKCDNKAASVGHDDVFIRWTVDGEEQKYQYPIWNEFEMDDDEDDKWQCGTVIKFNKSFKVELYAEGDKVETQEWELKEFSGVGDEVQHKLDNDTGLFNTGEVKYYLTAKLLEKG